MPVSIRFYSPPAITIPALTAAMVIKWLRVNHPQFPDNDNKRLLITRFLTSSTNKYGFLETHTFIDDLAFFERKQQDSLELEKLKHAKLVSARKQPGTPSPIHTLQIGVTFRTDSNGAAHLGNDVAGINSLNQLKHKLTGDKLFPFDVLAVALPRGASGGVTPEREASWADLDGIDLLYIPGGPTANDTQISDIVADAKLNRAVDGKNAKVKRIYDEHVSRAAYELKLIGVARSRGIPVLAVCAGSWRLLESYGGAVRTLEVTQRDKHKAKDTKDTWALRHQLTLLASKTLLKTARRDAEHDQVVDRVNSTHWAVADADPMPRRLRTGTDGARNHLVPSDMLEISAVDPDTQTVEAFESLYGAPTMGIQWHPESYLPGMLGADQAGDEDAQHISRSLFEFMVYAAATSAKRAGVIATFKTEALLFAALEDCIRQVAAKQMVGAANRYIGATDILPKALWSFRARRLDAVLDILGEYVRADAAGKAAEATEHLRVAKTELAGYGIVI